MYIYVSNCVLYGNYTLIMNIELEMGQVKTQLESSMNCLTHSRQEIMEMSQVGKEHFHQLDLIDSKEKST